jgi:DNA-binding transcriptional MerR regulator
MATDEKAWRFEELAALAASVADAEGDSRRVRWIPGPRTLRYYTTLGLLDRPLYFDGRIAYYGRKHLAQVVAVKRLQADGLSLAEVQVRMAGMTEAELLALAALPADLPTPAQASLARPPQRPDADAFWHTAPRDPVAGPALAGTTDGPSGPVGVYVTIAPGVTLFLEGLLRTPTATEIDRIRRAAAPLLAELRRKGDDDAR